MKYTLKKDDQIFETDMWVMADRKYAQGWKFHVEPKATPEATSPAKELTKKNTRAKVTHE